MADMMTVVADTSSSIDWSTTATAVTATALSALTALGAAGRWVLLHLQGRAKENRDHQVETMRTVEAIASGFTATLRETQREWQKEQRETIGTLLKIQGETVTAVTGLTAQVSGLSQAIVDLSRRVEIGTAGSETKGRARGSHGV
jgi:hypothetical protein